MMLFSHPTGPRIEYRNGTLQISDLNPEQDMQWKMTRFEMLRVGLRFMLAAVPTRREIDTIRKNRNSP